MLNQSPGAVGVTRERMWSAMDTAVLAALERPHFLMSAPPRVWMAGVKPFSSHAESEMTADAFSPSIWREGGGVNRAARRAALGRARTSALWKSGTCVVLWFPQMVMRVTLLLNTPALMASWHLARFSSRRVSAEKLRGLSRGALRIAISALVLHLQRRREALRQRKGRSDAACAGGRGRTGCPRPQPCSRRSPTR